MTELERELKIALREQEESFKSSLNMATATYEESIKRIAANAEQDLTDLTEQVSKLTELCASIGTQNQLILNELQQESGDESLINQLSPILENFSEKLAIQLRLILEERLPRR